VSSGKKKKAVDVALRKSDRRRLRTAALEYFTSLQTEEGSVAKDTTDALEKMLDSIFLQGTLVVRKLDHPQLNRVQLFFRGPSSTSASDDDNISHNTILWPYKSTTECIWLSIDLGPGEQPLECPTPSLFSVLPPPPSTSVVLVPPPVSKFICRGAHLMCAGIRQLPKDAQSGSIVPICVMGNPQPFAVGRQFVNEFEDASTGESKSGIGVQIYTCYGDDLYLSTTAVMTSKKSVKDDAILNPWGGAPYENGHYGNVGFLNGSLVQPLVTPSVDDSTGDSTDEDKTVNDVTHSDSTNDKQEGQDEAKKLMDGEEGDKGDDNIPSPDEVLHQCVCQALVMIKDRELPILTSTFYANYVLKQQTDDHKIELKQTTYKKLGAYLSRHCQDELELLTIRRTNGQEFLQSIQRSHLDLRGIKKSSLGATDAEADATKISIVNLYMIPKHISSLLRLDQDDVQAVNAKSTERQGTGMLTSKEAREILETYCHNNDLISKHGMDIILDGPLTDTFYPPKKNNNKDDIQSQLSRKEVQDLWISRLEPAYAMVQMPGSQITHLSRGQPPLIEMDVSRMGGNKLVTRLRGLEFYFKSSNIAEDFVQAATRTLACSGQVETKEPLWGVLPKGHAECVFAGHWLEELQAILLRNIKFSTHGGVQEVIENMGLPPIPKQVIRVRKLKKGIPARKRK